MQFRSKKRGQFKQHNQFLQQRTSRKQRQSRKNRQSRKQSVQLFEQEGGFNWALYENKNKSVKEVINRNEEAHPGIKQLCRKLGFVNSRGHASLDILAEFINANRELFGDETWSSHLGSKEKAEKLVTFLQQTRVSDAWQSIRGSQNEEVQLALAQPGTLGHSVIQHLAIENGEIDLEKKVLNPKVPLLEYIKSSPPSPSSSALVPSSSALVPRRFASGPSSSALVPSSSALVPSSSALVPSSSALVPRRFASGPSSSALVPSSSALVPSSSALVPSSASSDSTVTIPNGTLAILTGLQDKFSEFNGRQGIIEGINEGKYVVRLFQTENDKVERLFQVKTNKLILDVVKSNDTECVHDDIVRALSVLKLPESATVAEAVRSYRRLALATHPDRHPEKRDEFEQINKALSYVKNCLGA
jgi:hypothetical protein